MITVQPIYSQIPTQYIVIFFFAHKKIVFQQHSSLSLHIYRVLIFCNMLVAFVNSE